MADRHHLSDDHWVEVAHSVQHGTILHIALRADADGVHIAPDDCVHPDTRLFAENHVADYLRGRIDVAVRWNDWSYSLVRTNHDAADFTRTVRWLTKVDSGSFAVSYFLRIYAFCS